MLRSWLTSILLLGTLLLSFVLPAVASAQAPDTRDIRASMVIALDTSGSMERLGNCVCTTPSCNECLPVCSAPTYDKNRWSTVVEALTGTYNGFTCASINRSATYPGEYDENYFLPFHQIGFTTQNDDGVLDTYRDRVKFGLMTFDNVATQIGQNTLVPTASWNGAYSSNSNGINGMYSYAYERAFTFPGCATDYTINLGGRSDSPVGGIDTMAGQVPGNLVSVGIDTDDHVLINGRIQDSLLALRPYGATPTAGFLDDVRYYYNNHPDVVPVAMAGGPGDIFSNCRDRYVMLITDGYPNADFRGDPYNCDACDGPDADMDGFPDNCYVCPYDTPENIAANLCQYNGALSMQEGVVDGVFVIGFNVADMDAVNRLNDIASVGGTGSAIFADDFATLKAAIAAAVDQAAPGTTTRTVPVFTNANVVGVSQAQHQFNTGFNLAVSPGEPWHGVLERRRYECDGVNVVERPVDATDKFHEKLQTQIAGTGPTRRLFTALPSDPLNNQTWLTGDGAASIPVALMPTSIGSPVETGLDTVALSTASAAHINVADKTDVMNWMYANSSAPPAREDNPLGDIYHSSPQVKGPAQLDTDDDSFNAFRLAYEDQPTLLFVGTNDGILHAFYASDDTTVLGDQTGYEAWGFVPPFLLGSLEAGMTSHQWMVDGTPVVRDVVTARLPGDSPDADHYRTILIVGLRGGGDAYFALDVTDVADPKFLWQFTDVGMGDAYGQAGLAHVRIEINGNLHQRAVAVLPGGDGTPLGGSCAPAAAAQPPDIGGISPRANRRCWDNEGRSLYVVDIMTGLLLREWDNTLLHSPMVGGVSMYPSVDAVRGYMTDRDGVIWRINLENPIATNWELEPAYDMFQGMAFDAGQPAYYPPILSSDPDGNVVIIQGSGDIDFLDSTSSNRVVSLTEDVGFNASGVVTGITNTINWEVTTDLGEQITGPLSIFQSRVYFGTFKSDVSTTDACNFGFSRLWGVHYIDDDGTMVTPPYPLEAMESTPGSGVEDAHYRGPFDNQIVMGVGITQRPNCFTGVTETDPYLGSRYRITNRGGGQYQLVAQVGGDADPSDPAEILQLTQDLTLGAERTRVISRAVNID